MQNLGFPSGSPFRENPILPFLSVPTHFSPKPCISFSQSPCRLLKTSTRTPNHPSNLNLRRLTSRIVDLTRRKQLNQIFEEVEIAKRRYGRVNRIVMNSVMDACVRCKDLDSALRVFDVMSKSGSCGVDSVTYGILLKGLGNEKDLLTVQKLVVEMKSWSDLFIDRTAYTAVVDAFLACGSIGGVLCIYGEMIKQAGINKNLTPKPHLYLSMMRVFATRGEFDMVNKLHAHMWLDYVGSISPSARLEADELLMEAALNNNQIDVARQILSKTVTKESDFTWTSRGGMVAVRLEALLEHTGSLFTPYVLSQVSLDDPIDKYMTAFEDAKPLPASSRLKEVAMRFLKDSIVPVIDDWGSCVGFVHRDDCDELDAPLSSLMSVPPPCVTTPTSVGRVMDLILEKKYEAVVVVKNNNVYETSYSSSSRPVGIFTRKKMLELAIVQEVKRVVYRTKS